MADGASSAVSTRREGWIKIGLSAWAAIVFIVFCWWTIGYRGLVERAAEWQFGRVGSYFPALTLLIFVAMFGGPLLYVFGRRANQATASDNERAPATRFFRALLALTAVFAVAAALTAVYAYWPVDKRPLQKIDAAADAGAHATAPATLTGLVRYDRAAVARTSVLFDTRITRFVPVTAGDAKSPTVRYFVQAAGGQVEPGTETVSGILVRNGLRGDVVRLFEDAGFKVAAPYYVLFTDRPTMRAASLLAALQLGFVALIFALAAAYQRYRLRQLSTGRRRGTAHAVR